MQNNVISFKKAVEKIEKAKFEKLTIEIIQNILQEKYNLSENEALNQFNNYMFWFFKEYKKK